MTSTPSSQMQYQRLTSYLRGSLSPEEKGIVEEQLEQDPFLQDAVKGLQNLESVDQLDKQNRLIHQQLDKHIKNVRPTSISGWQYAAIAAMILLALLPILTSFMASEQELLYARYVDVYPNNIPIYRGETDKADIMFAMAEYETGNFNKAKQMLEELNRSQPASSPTYFYEQVARLHLGEYEVAQKGLSVYLDADSSEYQHAAKWYIALIHLRNGDTEQAALQLLELQKADGRYSRKSADLLQDLKTQLSVD